MNETAPVQKQDIDRLRTTVQMQVEAVVELVGLLRSQNEQFGVLVDTMREMVALQREMNRALPWKPFETVDVPGKPGRT